MPLEFAVGKKSSLWTKLTPWLSLAFLPLIVVLAVVCFLAFNRIGNTFPTAEVHVPEVREDVDAVYAGRKGLYETVWPLDTAEGEEKVQPWFDETRRPLPEQPKAAVPEVLATPATGVPEPTPIAEPTPPSR